MLQNNSAMNITPDSIEELKGFVKQFEMLLPEDKRAVIYNAIEEIETSGGIQNEEQAQKLLTNLMQGLGL